jgi:hypothetical protein
MLASGSARPEDGTHAPRHAADDQQNEALWPLHESHLAGRNQRFGARAGIADHERTRHGDCRKRHVERPADQGVVNDQAHVEGEIGIAVERRIEEGPESRDAADAARHLTIGHVEKAREKEHRRRPAKTPRGKPSGRPGIHAEPQEREHVRRKARRGERAYHMFQEPASAFADPVRDWAIRILGITAHLST